MSVKRKSNIDDSSEKCVIIADSDSVDPSDNDSDGSDIVLPVRKCPRKLIIEDDTDDEDSINHQLSKQWIWKEESNKPKIWEYMQTPGIGVAILDQLGRSKRELDFLYIMFDNVFWDNIVTETNRYAEQTIIDENKKKKIDETWIPVNSNEIKIYFALCIIMVQVKKPKIQMNWSKRAIIETPIFRKTMPLKRFLQITRFFHFANNDMTDKMDKLREVTPVINCFNKKFKEVYVMEENIAIDESLMKFKGRMSYRQFNPSKRARFGIKFYKLCESASGYCYNFKIYSRKDKTDLDYSASETVVMELSKSILNKGRTLYIDNWYSSPKLFLTLVENGTNVGTVRFNRKNMPGDFVKAKLKKGECRIRSCNGILALKWKDKQDVHILSTKHESVEMTEQNGSQLTPTFKPKCIVDYNRGMIGIDRKDQILAGFPVMRKYLKGYRKIFSHIFDMALFNSYILYNKNNMEKKRNYTEYRLQTAEALLQNVPSQDYKRRGPLSRTEIYQ
ncbi:PREDICTED: piggyBac transposable element-derived protein 4-like [Habropoda laboriosa]|uniref:piggyBac transposable element-derived protein 4-like n=1 Tax=Habropoda laboriosa TaxID=597456 RepID=UPI00083DB194|nr:PREDICTED: piggyBac transposable element-derived protein 4-like [Habropoda laboriosa]